MKTLLLAVSGVMVCVLSGVVFPLLVAAEPVDFEIPEQSLASALAEFAAKTDLQVLYSGELTRGQRTRGISGRYEPEEALGHLLKESGLEYRFTDHHTITLERAPVVPLPPGAPAPQSQEVPAHPAPATSPNSGKPLKLPEILVKDVKERGYTADDSSTAMRLPIPIQETPRSIEVVTRQVLDDQKVLRVQDALRNVSGASMPSSQGGRAGDFMIRGFRSDQSVFKNGFREDSTFGARASRDTANLESIEVIKGPPSYLYGRADPGGVINQITKSPLRERYSAVDLTVGSYNLYRPSVDLGGPLNDSKTLTYRFNGVYESSQSFREGVKIDRIFLAPTIGWELGPRTTLRFEAEYLHDRSPIDRGIVAVGSGPADIPIGRFLGDPTRRGEINQGKATLIFRHQFNEVWAWRTGFRSAVASEKYDSLESWFLLADNRTLELAAFRIPQTVQSHYLQNELHGHFSTGPIGHRLLLGVELGREVQKSTVLTDSSCAFLGTCAALNTIDILNPTYSFFNNPLSAINDSSQTNGIIGLYAGDQIDLLDNLHLNFGGRFDIFKQHLTNRPDAFDPTDREVEETHRAFSPSVGLTYAPLKTVALFANYTRSFMPQSPGARSSQGTLFDPTRGRQYEGGIKFQASDGRLRSTIALFDIVKTNVLTSEIGAGGAFTGFSIATGEQRSRGVEFDVAGRILPGWDVIANYAYIDARITKDNTFVENSRLDNVPYHQGSIWTQYFLQEGRLKGLGAGIGMYAQGQRNGIKLVQPTAFGQEPFNLAGFVRMDAAVYYRKQNIFNRTNLLASVNIYNLLDQRYFAGAQDFREIVYPGMPLTVIGSLKFEFY